MPGRLVFELNDDMFRILEDAKNNPCRIPYGGGKLADEKGFWLVKDSGVYVMSGSEKGLKASGKKEERALVVYATGHDPNIGSTWEQDRAVCGGDDFAELVPLGHLADIKPRQALAFAVDFTPAEFQVVTIVERDAWEAPFNMKDLGKVHPEANPGCPCCAGRGWGIFLRADVTYHPMERSIPVVQKCDRCNVFKDDVAAAKAAKTDVVARVKYPCFVSERELKRLENLVSWGGKRARSKEAQKYKLKPKSKRKKKACV